MTKLLYMDDMQAREFDAVITSVSGLDVELDQTLFYPESGGVSCDHGWLIGSEDYKVTFVKKQPGKILHTVDKPGLAVGDKVHGVLDWDRRHLMMRYHTAAHLISGVFSNTFGAKITGNQMDPEKGRIDFDLEQFDREMIERGFGIANELVAKDYPIKTYYLPRSEVEKNPQLVKLAMGLPPSIQELRIVEIVGFDTQPDGGCHVSHLKEIGKIEFLSAENKGKSNRRVYFRLL